eukprot:gene8002-16380_t
MSNHDDVSHSLPKRTMGMSTDSNNNNNNNNNNEHDDLSSVSGASIVRRGSGVSSDNPQKRLRRRLGQVAAAHRRCESQLSKRVVEDRMEAMQILVDISSKIANKQQQQQYNNNNSSNLSHSFSISHDDTTAGCGGVPYTVEDMTITIPILDCLLSHSDFKDNDHNHSTSSSNSNTTETTTSTSTASWIDLFDDKDNDNHSDNVSSIGVDIDESSLHHIHSRLLIHLTAQAKQSRDQENRSHLLPVLQSLSHGEFSLHARCASTATVDTVIIGLLLMSSRGGKLDFEGASRAFGEGCLVDQKMFVTSTETKCVRGTDNTTNTTTTTSNNNNNNNNNNNSISINTNRSQEVSSVSTRTGMSTAEVTEFLFWALTIGPLIGLQALRLITELMHRSLTRRVGLELATGMTAQRFDEMTIADAMSLPDSGGNGNGNHLVDEELTSFRRDLAHGVLSRRRGASSADAPTFSWVQSSVTSGTSSDSDVLNEVVHCISAVSSQACELSVQLLTKLREILRATWESSSNSSNGSSGNSQHRSSPPLSHVHGKIRIHPSLFRSISSSSAFRTFVIQSCQLQKVSLSALTVDQKTLFFCNIFNTIIVHAIVTKGLPGSGFYDRIAFMRSAKYNIGGHLFSLFEIEHAILRAKSANPALVGAFLSTVLFSDRDPRKAFALSEPSESSPLLTVIRDPLQLEFEMKKCAAVYLTSQVLVDKSSRSVTLPEILRFYWKDFGGTRAKVLKYISLLTSPPLSTDLKILLADETTKVKVNFASFDWAPVLIL